MSVGGPDGSLLADAAPPAAPAPARGLGVRLLRNAASNFGAFTISFVVAFFLLPFTVAHIGAAQYGVLVLVRSLVGYSGLLQFGLRPTLIKKASEHLATGNVAAASRVTSQVYTLYWGLAGVLLAGAAVVFVLAPELFTRVGDVGLFRAVFVLVAVQAALSFPSTVWTALIEGKQAHPVSNAVKVAGEAATAAATIGLLLAGYGLVALVAANLVISLGQWTVSRLWVRRHLPELEVRIRRTPWAEQKELLRFSGSMFLLGLSGTVEATTDKLVIGVFAPTAALTTFEVGDRLNAFSRGVMTQVLSVLMPAASALSALDDRARLRALLVMLTRCVVFAYGLAVVPLVVFGDTLIRLWMGPGFAAAYLVLAFLAAASFSQAHNAIAGSLIRGMGVLRFLTRVSLARGVGNVVLTVLLIRRFGLPGVAFATLLAYVAGDLVLTGYYARVFDVPLPRILRDVHLRAWLCLVPVVGVALVADRVLGVHSWPALLGATAACALVGGATFWSLGMPAEDRARLLSTVRAAVRRRATPAPTRP